MHCTIAREMIEKSIESDGATNKLDLSIFFFSSFASFQIIFFAGPFFRSRSDHGHTYTRRMMEIHWQTHALLVFRIRGSFFRVSFGDCQTEIHNAKIYSRPKKDSTEKKNKTILPAKNYRTRRTHNGQKFNGETKKKKTTESNNEQNANGRVENKKESNKTTAQHLDKSLLCVHCVSVWIFFFARRSHVQLDTRSARRRNSLNTFYFVCIDGHFKMKMKFASHLKLDSWCLKFVLKFSPFFFFAR